MADRRDDVCPGKLYNVGIKMIYTRGLGVFKISDDLSTSSGNTAEMEKKTVLPVIILLTVVIGSFFCLGMFLLMSLTLLM